MPALAAPAMLPAKMPFYYTGKMRIWPVGFSLISGVFRHVRMAQRVMRLNIRKSQKCRDGTPKTQKTGHPISVKHWVLGKYKSAARMKYVTNLKNGKDAIIIIIIILILILLFSLI